ncbi:MAG: NADP-dependent oxidoreductase, partial [Gemmatimonadota bacterium]|nr:NADP-dependent oxidoreductase [Gemmatimonadota bacterium]
MTPSTSARSAATRRAIPSAIPATMRAAAIDRFGGPEVLSIHTLPVPEPSAQEVLIALDAAGVGSWDARQRDGAWSAEGEERFPLIPGTDGAGTVVSVGARVERLAVGDYVYSYGYANPKGGFYAEYVAVSAGKVALVPDALDEIHAGAVPTIGLTALQGVDDTLELAEGESVIIHGASGNVGMLAVQFAKYRGARVLATASGADGVEFVRRLGADDAVDGRRDDIVAAAKRFAPDGIDAVLALVGGEELTRCLDALRAGGRLAYPNGIEPEPRRRRGLSIKAYDAEPGSRQFDRLGRAIEEARLEIPIAEVFSLEDAAKAHERLERGHVLGK